MILSAKADTIYSNLQNTAIPLDFTGVTVTLAGGGSINPFFGGVGVANNNLLQPGRTAAGNLGALQNFAVGSTIDAGLLRGTGYGGSQDHVGNTFTAGQEGYIGFKLNNANYGWMRVVFTGNTSGAVIKDWAYDNSGTAIVAGRVQQSAVLSGAQTVTLSPGSGESFSLGSAITNTGGNVNSLVKTGAGTTTLTASNTFTGSTTINGGTLALGASGSIDSTSGVSLGTDGTFDVSAKSGGYSVGVLTGSGTVIGSLSVSTQLAIGGSGVGTTNFSNNLTLESASRYVYEMTGGATPGAASADLGNVAGDLTISAGSILDLLDLGTYTMGNKFTLFAYEGSLTGQFTDTSSNVLANGATFTDAGGVWRIDYADSTAGANGGVSRSNSFVTITAVPEPDVAGCIGALGLAFIILRRR